MFPVVTWLLVLGAAFVVVMYGLPLLGLAVAWSGALIAAAFIVAMIFLFMTLRGRRRTRS